MDGAPPPNTIGSPKCHPSHLTSLGDGALYLCSQGACPGRRAVDQQRPTRWAGREKQSWAEGEAGLPCGGNKGPADLTEGLRSQPKVQQEDLAFAAYMYLSLIWDDSGRRVTLGKAALASQGQFQEKLTVESYLLPPCSAGRRRVWECPVQPLSEQEEILEAPKAVPLRRRNRSHPAPEGHLLSIGTLLGTGSHCWEAPVVSCFFFLLSHSF